MRMYRLDNKNKYCEVHQWEHADWLRFDNPSLDEIDQLHQKTNIPKDFITSALDPYEIARQEKFTTAEGEEVKLIIIQYPLDVEQNRDSVEYEILPLSIILHPDGIITVSSRNIPFLEEIASNDFLGSETNLAHGEIEESHLVLKILWKVTNQYINGTTEIDIAINQMEDNILKTTKNKIFNQLISVHKSLVYFRTGITRNHEQVLTLNHIEELFTNKLSNELLHDITVYSNQAKAMVEVSDEMIRHLSETFSSAISYNLNIVMKFLTSLTILLAIPEVVGAIWGMNVPIPFQESPTIFHAILIAMVAISILIIAWFKKKDYL